ncbi:MAG: hypothetical protein B6I36_03540 [Desulfobacteraceae bacterium 4572_35.1]|nr:MAG: hypothetical protein B6I36_03540 [Desulfobacteraceae bacterium 4572_35.1]
MFLPKLGARLIFSRNSLKAKAIIMTIETTNKKLSSSKKFLLICFLLFTTLISIFGFGFYYYQKQTVIEAAKTNLSNLADLKAHQIGHWRHERISRAHLLSTNKLFLHSVQHYIEHQDNTSRENIIQALLPALGQNNLNGDHGVLITDHLGQTLLHVGESADWSRRSDKQKIAIIRQNGKPLFSKIYLDQITSESCQRNCDAPFKPHLHMDLTVPLYDNNKLTTMMGSIIFIIDPNTFLLPLVGLWPTSSISAESVLVRKIDDKVIRLTPLRHNNGEEPLVTIKPPKGIDTPGKHIKDGECGVIDGYDYRQKKVFAAIQKVPDSPWYIVTKIDQSEVLSFMTKLGAIIFASAISIVIAVGMIMWLWWRRQQAISRALHYEQELQNRTILSRFDNLTRHSNDIIVLCSEEGDIIDANQRALEAYGQPLETLRTHKLCSMCDIGDNGCNLLWQQLSANGETKFDSHQFRRDGSTFPVEINATWIKVGERKLLQAIIRDVSERKEAAQQLLHQAQHDPLTGLPNRTLITDRLHQAIGKCKRHDNQLALLFLDLDRFKNINDTLGHAAGDQLLVNIAQRIKKSLREVDTVARFGGDEFMILVEDITNIADIATLALKLIDAIEQPIFLGQQEIYVTTSTGITVAPDDSDNTEELIRFVETAMYRAKERGRNNYQFYTSDMNAHTHEHLKLETSLRKALANKEFVVHYQPQVELSSGKIIGSEALVRWQHPESIRTPVSR